MQEKRLFCKTKFQFARVSAKSAIYSQFIRRFLEEVMV